MSLRHDLTITDRPCQFPRWECLMIGHRGHNLTTAACTCGMTITGNDRAAVLEQAFGHYIDVLQALHPLVTETTGHITFTREEATT